MRIREIFLQLRLIADTPPPPGLKGRRVNTRVHCVLHAKLLVSRARNACACSSALDTLTSNVASSLDCHLKDDDKRTRDSITEAFRTAMVGYVYGEDADVAKFYDHEVEPVIALGEEEERYKRMVDVLRCVEGEKKREGSGVYA